jgi:hypothetical protein
MVTKICKRCGKEKELSMFAKYRNRKGVLLRKTTCRECHKPSQRKHYINHAAEIITKNSEYKKQNRAQVNERNKERRKNDPIFKMREAVRGAIKMTLKRLKNGVSINKYLPYSIQELKEYLENQFESWMTWENHGKYNTKTWNNNDPTTWTWQLDHIIPQSDLPYTSMEEENFQKCWSLNNLRPLSAKQNIIEGPARARHRGAKS